VQLGLDVSEPRVARRHDDGRLLGRHGGLRVVVYRSVGRGQTLALPLGLGALAVVQLLAARPPHVVVLVPGICRKEIRKAYSVQKLTDFKRFQNWKHVVVVVP